MVSPWGSRRDGAAPRVTSGTARTDEDAVVMRRGVRRAGGDGQSLLNCPRCGLTIKVRAPWLAIRFCPRCLARTHTVAELFSSPLPQEVLYADASAPGADRCGSERCLGLQ
jgi:hypothetical protein